MAIISPKKKAMKTTLPISILKPETSSDSPSIKSKGARFSSARMQTPRRKTNQGYFPTPRKKLKLLMFHNINTAAMTINPTSYLSIWASPRCAPIHA